MRGERERGRESGERGKKEGGGRKRWEREGEGGEREKEGGRELMPAQGGAEGNGCLGGRCVTGTYEQGLGSLGSHMGFDTQLQVCINGDICPFCQR